VWRLGRSYGLPRRAARGGQAAVAPPAALSAAGGGHMRHHLKLRNMERDPGVVLSFDAPRESGVFLNPYGVLHARATVEPSDHAWDLLNRLTRTYVAPDVEYPAPRGPGYIVRYTIERIGGVGPWARPR